MPSSTRPTRATRSMHPLVTRRTRVPSHTSTSSLQPPPHLQHQCPRLCQHSHPRALLPKLAAGVVLCALVSNASINRVCLSRRRYCTALDTTNSLSAWHIARTTAMSNAVNSMCPRLCAVGTRYHPVWAQSCPLPCRERRRRAPIERDPQSCQKHRRGQLRQLLPTSAM